MKLVSKPLGLVTRLAALAGAMLLSQQAVAVGTPAGTSISNTANVGYSVGGVPQASIPSDPLTATFTVDNRVDMTLGQSGNLGRTIVTSGQSGNWVEFTLENTGNQSQGYQLNATALATPDFQMLLPEVYVESGANAGYQPGEDTLQIIDTLADNATAVIYVVANAPGGLSDGDLSDVTLQAVTTAAGTGAAAPLAASGAPTAGEDVVLAVGGVNGTGDATETDGYIVELVTLGIVKSIVSTVDEFGNGYSIPGAVVTYDVAVTNPSTTTAVTSVSITDTLTELLIEAPASTTVTLTNAFDDGTPPVAVATCTADLADGDGDGCGVDVATSPQVLTLGNGSGLGTFTIPANTTTTFRFEATIQ